jgi:hypothetical protein
VVQRECEGLAEPVRDAAALAERGLQPVGEQPALEVPPPSRRPRHEQLLDGRGVGTGDDVAAPARRVPRLSREPEPLLAFGHRVPFVVEALDLGPVIAAGEARIGAASKRARVVGDGVLGDAEALGDLRVVQATLH